MTAAITTEQIKIIHALLPPSLKDPELKAEFIASFTEDPSKSSTKDLTYFQAADVIYFLRTGKNQKYASWALFDNDNKQHRYILSLCRQLGWITHDKKKNKLLPDLERLGNWLHKYGYLHKPLKQYTDKELPRLVTQLQNILTK